MGYLAMFTFRLDNTRDKHCQHPIAAFYTHNKTTKFGVCLLFDHAGSDFVPKFEHLMIFLTKAIFTFSKFAILLP